MENQLPGIHHITAIGGQPQQSIELSAGVLGLRLVKLTITFMPFAARVVELHWHEGGHELGQDDLETAKVWLEGLPA